MGIFCRPYLVHVVIELSFVRPKVSCALVRKTLAIITRLYYLTPFFEFVLRYIQKRWEIFFNVKPKICGLYLKEVSVQDRAIMARVMYFFLFYSKMNDICIFLKFLV